MSVTILTQQHHLLHALGLSTKWAVTSHSSHPPKCPRTLSSFLHHVATTGVLISAGSPHDGDHKVTVNKHMPSLSMSISLPELQAWAGVLHSDLHLPQDGGQHLDTVLPPPLTLLPACIGPFSCQGPDTALRRNSHHLGDS